MGSDTTSITKLGLNNGDVIYLQNPTAELATVVKPKVETKTEFKEDPKAKCNHSINETCINCIEKIKKQQEEKKDKVEVKKDAKEEWNKLIAEANKNKKKVPIIEEKKHFCPIE